MLLELRIPHRVTRRQRRRGTTGRALRQLVFRPAYPAHGAIWLHLGCGRTAKPGFVNIDALPWRNIHHVRSIGDLRIFPTASVEFIYLSHALEHFSHREIRSVLQEWHRVLRLEGKLCISVPDFDLLLAIYLETGRHMDDILQPLMGGQDCRYNFHCTAFNREESHSRTHGDGFSRVAASTPGSDTPARVRSGSFRDFHSRIAPASSCASVSASAAVSPFTTRCPIRSGPT